MRTEMFDCEQLSLFGPRLTGTVAVSLFTNRRCDAEKLELWMNKLVPDGKYFVMVGNHPLVLRATTMKREDVPNGHQFYHYQVGDTVYAGIFVGKEVD